MEQSERISLFVDAIWQWFLVHKRHLPWRDVVIEDDTQRAYQVLVSEIMLQQTQVSRVIVKYQEFLDRFPTISDLARASNKDVILTWQGMGYNSRALRLRDAAKKIENLKLKIENRPFDTPVCHPECSSSQRSEGEECIEGDTLALRVTQVKDCKFPATYDDLITIPGIGPYTAAAILNFAFNIPTPCIDTNIRRILHRTFVGPENADGTWQKNDRALLEIADQILVEVFQWKISTADWHAALMDFGSLVQTKVNPKWDACPLTEKGIMKATPANMPELHKKKSAPKEPGRFMNKKFVPNRIFRGKIVEYLRNNHQADAEDIGAAICNDWSKGDLSDWLQVLLEKLEDDQLIENSDNRYALKT